ncbi:TPA: hypothetical protein ACSI7L_005458, partial [Klebsiella pneumoniae]
MSAGGDKAVCVIPIEANASISYFVNLKIFLYTALSVILRAEVLKTIRSGGCFKYQQVVFLTL